LPVSVLIADDHKIVREGLKALLEREGFKVVGEAADGEQALQLAGTLHPDVAVLDVAMPVLNGIETAGEMHAVSPKTKSILLTMHVDSRYILAGLRSGAKGYVMKTNTAEDLVRAIREAERGGMYLSPQIAEAVIQAYQNHTEIPDSPLSARELQVLKLIADGKITKEVATVLGISVKTAETYRSRIMEKLDLHITADLVRYAVRHGVVQD
jgi:two-component system, NarL family, response regulator NreC